MLFNLVICFDVLDVDQENWEGFVTSMSGLTRYDTKREADLALEVVTKPRTFFVPSGTDLFYLKDERRPDHSLGTHAFDEFSANAKLVGFR